MNEPYPNPSPTPPKRHSNVLPIILTVFLSLTVLTLTAIVIFLAFVRNEVRKEYAAITAGREPSTEMMTAPETEPVTAWVAVPETEAPPVPVSSEEMTEPGYADDAEAYLEYYDEVFDEFLTESDDPDSVRYDLYDLDGDSIPELFISEGEWHFATVSLYTYFDGAGMLVSRGMLGSYGTIRLDQDTGFLVDYFSNQGYSSRRDYYYNRGELTLVFSSSENTGAVTDPAEYELFINDQAVTIDEFNSAIAEHTVNEVIELGRYYDPAESDDAEYDDMDE